MGKNVVFLFLKLAVVNRVVAEFFMYPASVFYGSGRCVALLYKISFWFFSRVLLIERKQRENPEKGKATVIKIQIQ
jgi:hypothetical protein